MNIAVFGWYHHRNAGDDRIQYCVTRWLDGHTLAFLPAGRPPPLHMLRTYDAVIIGGGGLIMATGGVFRNMARWVQALGIPVALVGVSVEAITPALRAELRAFLDVCCFAWFRDQGSLDDVGPHPRAFVAPDLTWLYPFPVLPAAGDSLALCLRKHRTLAVEPWRQAMGTIHRPILPWPLYFEGGGDAALLKEILPQSTVPEEFTLEPLRNSRIAVSGRYHGLLFALQSGRPCVAVSSLPKTRRFLAEHGLGDWWIAEADPGDLASVLRKWETDYERVLPQIAALRASLADQAQFQGQSARDRLCDAAAALPPPSRRWGTRARQILDLGSYF